MTLEPDPIGYAYCEDSGKFNHQRLLVGCKPGYCPKLVVR